MAIVGAPWLTCAVSHDALLVTAASQALADDARTDQKFSWSPKVSVGWSTVKVQDCAPAGCRPAAISPAASASVSDAAARNRLLMDYLLEASSTLSGIRRSMPSHPRCTKTKAKFPVNSAPGCQRKMPRCVSSDAPTGSGPATSPVSRCPS